MAVTAGTGGGGSGGRGGAAGGAPADAGDAAVVDGAVVDGSSSSAIPVPACSSDGWCWMRPRPTGNIIENIQGSAPSDLWAGGNAGTALHWDGHAWSGHPVTGEVYDVAGLLSLGQNDVWAIGQDGFFHWDGADWTLSLKLEAAAISGTGPSNAWAITSGGELMSLQQTGWGPRGPVGNDSCATIWASSPTDVWIGCATMIHYDGTSFTDTGTVPGAFQMSGSGASEVWAATPNGAWHWNGTTWAQAGLAGTILYDISVRAAGDVWAIDQEDALHHWQGSSWQQTWQGQPSTTRCVFAAPGADVWVGGTDGLLLRGDGTTMAPATDTPATPVAWARGSTGVAPNHLWITTDSGVQVWDGTAWTTMPGTSGKAYTQIWASAVDDVWMVDNDFVLWRWDGSTLHNMLSFPGFLTGSAANDVWASYQHWDGTSWTVTGAGDSGYTQTAEWASGPSDAWIVGSDGYIKHWDGTSWTRMTGFGTLRLAAVWGTGPSDVWVGGDNEQVSRWDGQKWTPLHNVSGNPQVNGFAGVPGDVWILGGATGALHWDGTSVTPSWIGSYDPFTGIWGTPGFGMFASGASGIIRHDW